MIASVLARVLKTASWIIIAPVAAQQSVPVAVLPQQPDSPLEVVSMRPGAPPAGTATKLATYDVVLRNKTRVPIMAYAISHESPAGGKTNRICQSSQGFSKPMIAGGETKTAQASLNVSGRPQVTPVIDLVLLQDGTYFGADSCGVLNEYQTGLGARRAAYQTIVQRLLKDGPEETTTWLRQELDRNPEPFFNPKKLN